MAGHMGKHSVLSMYVATNHLFTINQSVSACVHLTQKEIETFQGLKVLLQGLKQWKLCVVKETKFKQHIAPFALFWN